jgi:5-formyltetrahydrofolate cyclo-ligase
MTLFDEKKQFRQHALRTRRALSVTQKNDFSHQVCKQVQHFLESDCMSDDKQLLTILSYMALSDEVDLTQFNTWCVENGHTLLVPRVIDEKQGTLSLHECNENTKFEKSRYGICEPLNEPISADSWHDIRVALIPGVAYDTRGTRLGFGGGFYDRLVPRLANATIVAPIFDCQLFDDIPKAPHDITVDVLVSERIVVKCSDKS